MSLESIHCKTPHTDTYVPQDNRNYTQVQTPVRLFLPEKRFGIAVTLFLTVFKVLSFVYDIVTWVGYYTFQRTRRAERMELRNRTKAEVISRQKGSMTWRSNKEVRDIHVELEKEKINTMHKVYTFAIRKFGSNKCLGTRDLLSEEDLVENGKLMKKCEFGQYQWKTYNEIEHLASRFVLGLTTLNLKPKDRICIFAETRAEWLIAAVGAFKNNYTVATLYSTLGEDALIHGLNETEATVVLTSSELLPKFMPILIKTRHVRHIIYMEHQLQKTMDTSEYPSTLHIHKFSEIINRGVDLDIRLEAPGPDDIAIIMYTSGSTDVPKGVLLSHKNIASAMVDGTDVFGQVTSKDIYCAYHPLAHVFELAAESACFLQGVSIGYSSPLTLTNSSPKIKSGSSGDTSVLKPSIMITVPFALDRIQKLIKGQVDESSAIKQAIFYFAYDYKLKWTYKGYDTPLVDRLIMKKTKMSIGGKVRVLVSGGAPLARETQEFVQTCLCIPIGQGFALTETCSSATCTIQGDMTLGSVGPPNRSADIRLINWDEGNYTIDDVPFPRGELVVGGDIVSKGYFKLAESTAQDFFEEGEKRWFRTGDIAEAMADGSFKIIDRKKDLVKLQRGEYLSMGKIESILKTCQYVDNICVYGDSTKDVCVALVTPIPRMMELLATSMGIDNLTLTEMCLDTEIGSAFLNIIQNFAKSTRLHRSEIPAAIKLCPELWTPDNDLITSTFKLKRRNVQKRYKADIEDMYAGIRTKFGS